MGARRFSHFKMRAMKTIWFRSRNGAKMNGATRLTMPRLAVAAVAALATLTAGDKRGQVIEIDGATILNDCYNSNPEALRSMIRTLAARPAERRILVAGEMLELGEYGAAMHAACGITAAEAGLDLVAGVQGNAVNLAAAACAGGVASLFLPNAEEAGRWLKQTLRPGDVVLVKGSRGVHLERAIEVVNSGVARAGKQ